MLASPLKSRCIVAGIVAVISLGIVVSSVLRVQGQAPPTHTLRFVVQISPDDLTVDAIPIPNAQAAIHRVSLRPNGFPVGQSADPGKPMLPFVTRSIAIPPGAQALTVSATPLKSEIAATGVTLVEWAQRPRPGQNGPPPPIYDPGPDPFFPAPAAIPLDPSVLKGPAWPPLLVEENAVADALGYQLTTLRISPVQWSLAQEQLILHTEMLVQVTWQGGAAPQLGGGFAEAMQIADLRSQIVNPEYVLPIPIPAEPLSGDIWYLVVTDNFYWNEDMTRGGFIGDVAGELQRLADWKKRKGIKAGVVRISDIVNGVYGDFTTGARDLQEVIRNFLKFANQNWNTRWVLLGGDVEIVPARTALGETGNDGLAHWLESGTTDERPGVGKSKWDASTETLRIHLAPPPFYLPEPFDNSTALVDSVSGRAYLHVAAPSAANPGWAFASSDAYDMESDSPTEFVVLRGPTEEVAHLSPIAALKSNLIPTDFYYASLRSRLYGIAGLHDWDANGNGLYGQHHGADAYDGVNFFANVAVGRAPVKSPRDAQVFVDKVMAYERHPADLFPPSFGSRALFAAGNWDDSAPAVTALGDCADLGEGEYCSANRFVPFSTTRMRFSSARAVTSRWRLVVQFAGGVSQVIPYDPTTRGAAPRRNGYYYCTDQSCATTAEMTIHGSAGTVTMPLPTQWVQVEFNDVPLPGIGGGIGTFFFEGVGPDDAVSQKEHVRWELSLLASGLSAHTRLYQDVRDAPAEPGVPTRALSAREITSYMATGVNVASFSGHGLPGGCCGFDSSLVPGYDNGVRGGVAFVDSCLTNAFDEPRAVSELLLLSPDGGFAGYVGSTRVGWIGYGANFEQLFWSRLPFTRRVGELLNARVVYAHNDADLWSIFALNLLGDPEMELWSGTPATLRVEHPSRVRAGSLFAVGVRTADDAPLVGARVTITYADGAFVSGLTDADGQYRFRARGADGDRLGVTVTHPDHRPYLGDIIIETGTRFERPLFAGLNLISTPIAPTDPAIDRVFSAIQDAVQLVRTWDRATQRLLTWEPGHANNTLTRFEPGRGYEVWMRTASPFVIVGDPVVLSVRLWPGANYVGYSGLSPLTPSVAFASIRGAYNAAYTWNAQTGGLQWFIPGLPRLSTLARIEPGMGYVILATKPALWTLPQTQESGQVPHP